jgi:hypothetical protein
LSLSNAHTVVLKTSFLTGGKTFVSLRTKSQHGQACNHDVNDFQNKEKDERFQLVRKSTHIWEFDLSEKVLAERKFARPFFALVQYRCRIVGGESSSSAFDNLIVANPTTIAALKGRETMMHKVAGQPRICSQ